MCCISMLMYLSRVVHVPSHSKTQCNTCVCVDVFLLGQVANWLKVQHFESKSAQSESRTGKP